MSNKYILKFTKHISLVKIIQLAYILVMATGTLLIIFTANQIYRNYINAINYSGSTGTNVPAGNYSEDFKNLENIIKKVDNKAGKKKDAEINNIFD
jgi:hypothetical protein